jgi:hypothetical protein
MRWRFTDVKLSALTRYKVRSLGDIGDATRSTTGLRALNFSVSITLDFAVASTNGSRTQSIAVAATWRSARFDHLTPRSSIAFAAALRTEDSM